MRQQNGLLKIRVVKLLTGLAFGSRYSFSHCMHGVDMHCQGSFFGPDVVHRCSGHLCILSRFLGANLSLSHLSVVLTLLHHLYAPINAHILRSRGTLSMSLPGEVAGGWSSSRGLRSQTLIIFFLPSASHSLDDHSSHQMDRQIGCLLLSPSHFFFILLILSLSLCGSSLWPPGPHAHAGEGRRLQYWIISQLCAGQQRIYHNPAALFSAF